jgi:hypothetical protein
MKSNRLLAWGAVMAASIGLAGAARADCATRHFYNNTNAVFEIAMGGPGTCSTGSGPMQAHCFVPPSGSAELHYPNGITSTAAFAIRSDDGGLVFPLRAYPVSVSPGRCYINHDGNTGNIVVNEPADGDVTTCGKGYACKISANKKP